MKKVPPKPITLPKLPARPLSEAAFNKLSDVRKRRLLVTDALVTLSLPAAKHPVIQCGGYVDTYGVNISKQKQRRLAEFKGLCSLGDVLEVAAPACHVCALGMLFLSHVNRFNQVAVEIGFNTSEIDSDDVLGAISRSYDDGVMLDYFPYWNLRNIEGAFEGWYREETRRDGTYCYFAGDAWTNAIPNDTARLRAILRNILRTKDCLFDPAQPPVKADGKRWVAE